MEMGWRAWRLNKVLTCSRHTECFPDLQGKYIFTLYIWDTYKPLKLLWGKPGLTWRSLSNVRIDSDGLWLRVKSISKHWISQTREKKGIKFQKPNTHLQCILTYFPIIWELSKKSEEHKNLSSSIPSFSTFLFSLIGTFASQWCCSRYVCSFQITVIVRKRKI